LSVEHKAGFVNQYARFVTMRTGLKGYDNIRKVLSIARVANARNVGITSVSGLLNSTIETQNKKIPIGTRCAVAAWSVY